MMTGSIIIAVLSFAGTLVGTFAGILTGTKLTNYRLEQLERKVEKHNSVVERTFELEGKVKELQHEVIDLKGYHRPTERGA